MENYPVFEKLTHVIQYGLQRVIAWFQTVEDSSLEIMGLATIDSHSQKEHTEIHKIPKFGVNQASFDWDTAI